MLQYENDDRAIARVIASLSEGETIDHGTARAIAAPYNDYRTEHFVSTGYMPQGDAEWLMEAICRGVDQTALDRDREALGALRVYLSEREENGDTGRVDGWSDMWVAKHVDYPHEPGRLYDCPACESECHCIEEEEPCVHCSAQFEGA
ncbi:hypothetical protein [Streptomyces himalayensis]|uniref:Uncharacterized protein n=1 Tax=Streptomyces himalayensis subsp. himalayensis TaxID=2756131 RepID=A0A7W0DVD7_9ACTN|nr:hypothetical protein [Streptomyces himalayensis]MBA2951418.1 hypothetical protein [Streptomyces himalayensis subsp. himalayensis]